MNGSNDTGAGEKDQDYFVIIGYSYYPWSGPSYLKVDLDWYKYILQILGQPVKKRLKLKKIIDMLKKKEIEPYKMLS